MNVSEKKLFFLIILLSAVLRFYGLGYIHPIQGDEAAIGNDAYSILLTGRDISGRSFPLFFKAWGDYKSPFAVYFTVPFVALLGLSTFAVRVPVAILGILSVLLLYLLVKRIFDVKIALMSSFLLAVSPWHLVLTTLNYEVGYYIFMTLLGVYLCYRGLENERYIILAAIVFGLNLYTTQKAYITSPLLFVGFLLYLREINFQDRTTQVGYRIVALFIFILFIIPLGYAYLFMHDEMMARFTQVSVFQEVDGVWQIFINTLKRISAGLFLDMCSDSLTSPSGLLYYFQIPFVIIGLLHLLRENIRIKGRIFLIFWLFVSIIPSAFTIFSWCEISRRMVEPVFVLQILSAYGAYVSMKYYYTEPKMKKMLGLLVLLLITANIILFLKYFFVIKTTEYPFLGLDRGVEYAREHLGEYDEVGLLTNENMIVLFLSKQNPATYQTVGFNKIKPCTVMYHNENLAFCNYEFNSTIHTLFILVEPLGLPKAFQFRGVETLSDNDTIIAEYFEYKPEFITSEEKNLLSTNQTVFLKFWAQGNTKFSKFATR